MSGTQHCLSMLQLILCYLRGYGFFLARQLAKQRSSVLTGPVRTGRNNPVCVHHIKTWQLCYQQDEHNCIRSVGADKHTSNNLETTTCGTLTPCQEFPNTMSAQRSPDYQFRIPPLIHTKSTPHGWSTLKERVWRITTYPFPIKPIMVRLNPDIAHHPSSRYVCADPNFSEVGHGYCRVQSCESCSNWGHESASVCTNSPRDYLGSCLETAACKGVAFAQSDSL